MFLSNVPIDWDQFLLLVLDVLEHPDHKYQGFHTRTFVGQAVADLEKFCRNVVETDKAK